LVVLPVLAAGFAEILFFAFLVIAAIALIVGLARGRGPGNLL
jgi:uncharacterized membrane protein YtjA (UPF0391 family)